MKQSSAVSRLAGSFLLFLMLALGLFLIAWQRHKITANVFTNFAALAGALAGVLWSAQSTGPKLGAALDRLFSSLIPQNTLFRRIAGVLFGVVLFSCLLAAQLAKHPAAGPQPSLPGYVKVSLLLIAVVLGHLGINASSDLIRRFRTNFAFGELAQQALLMVGVIGILLFGSVAAGVEWMLKFYVCYFLGVGLVQVVISPISISESARELAGGKSITVGVVLFLSALAFIFLLAGWAL